MTDVLTRSQRSYCMSKIRGKNTEPELRLRRELWHRGLRYRLHYRLLGKPDLVFLGPKVVVFIDGCFWHKCPDHFRWPTSRPEFWREKIGANVMRDQRVTKALNEEGWKVLRFWEHQIQGDLRTVVEEIYGVVAPRRR